MKKINSKTLVRQMKVTRSQINEEDRTVDLAFSSEEPVERWFGKEILDHNPESVRLGRMENGAAVLVGHNPDDQVGVVTTVSIDEDRKGRVRVRFGRSERATEIFNDVLDGIRQHVSVGYQILSANVIERDEGSEADTILVNDWEPYEVSIVSIPADPTVGVGRAFERETAAEETLIPQKVNVMDPKKEKKAPAVDTLDAENRARADERQRITLIRAGGEKFGQENLASDFIRDGKTVDQFREALLSNIEKDQGATAPPTSLDMSKDEVQNYSLMRAIQASVSGNWDKAGLEQECSIAIADKLGKDARGFYVPFNIQTRDMTTGVAADGGNLVGTDHLSGSFIESLREESIIAQLGARFLTGLVGDVDIPRMDGNGTFYWIDEDADVTDSDAQIGSVALTPKTVAGSVPMSRRLLKQSSPAVDQLIMGDLTRGAALAIDAAALAGTGASNQPRGIVNVTGVNGVAVASNGQPTWDELVAFETAVAAASAARGTLNYVATAGVIGNLKTTKKDAGSGLYLMEGGQANGYDVNRTNNVPDDTIIFGNFNDLVVGMWGVLDVMPDHAAKAASGGLVLRVFQDVDIAVRHPESFSVATYA